MLPRLLLLLLALGLARSGWATHLLGGEMTYRYLDANGPTTAPLRYEITVIVYNNCSTSTLIRPSATVNIYDRATGGPITLSSVNYPHVGSQPGLIIISQTSITDCTLPAIPPGCTITGPSQPYKLQKFTAIVNLPATTSGYYAVFADGNRNVDVANLSNPGSETLMLYTAMNPPTIPNHSPVFSDVAVAVICAGDTTILLNNAVDADGDRLSYSFGHPYGQQNTATTGTILPPFSFNASPPLIPYALGYSQGMPFGTGASNVATIDSNTGIATYSASMQGRYVVAVDVQEYRYIAGQEVLIGTTRRDLQLVAASCPPSKAPVLPTALATPRSYTIEAGSTLTIPVKVTQADGHPLTMTLNSELLDGPGGHAATVNGDPGTITPGSLTGTATVTGTSGTVMGTILYQAGCNEARTAPYDIALTVKDTGCAGKSVADIFHITVVKPTGPNTISGDQQVCGLNTTHTYTASGGTASHFSWRVVGGSIVGSSTTNPVQVRWPAAGPGQLVARNVSQYGCLVDSAVLSVMVAAGTPLTVSGNQSICSGSSTSLAVSGSPSYTLTGGAAPLTGTGPFVLSPTQTTIYTIIGVPNAGGCAPSTQVTVTVLPPPAANVGPATASTCSDLAVRLGATAVAGSTYSWSPATGLSNATAANPALTLTNATGTPITRVYTLTETITATGCQASNTVTVTVNSAVQGGTIGVDQMVCANSVPAALVSAAGASSGTGTYTYQWESSADNVGWNAIAGATSADYAPSTVAATTYYRRQSLANNCGAAVSNVVTVHTQAPLQAGVSLATPAAQCAGTAFTFTPVPTNAGQAPTYAWFVNGVLAATGASFSNSTLANGDQVRVELTPTAGFCAVGPASATVSISLTPAPRPRVAISAHTKLPVCVGSSIAFQVDSTAHAGASPAYQWLVNGAALAGATGPTFSSTQLQNGQVVTLALTVPTTCGVLTVTSGAVRAVVLPLVSVQAGPNKDIMEGDQVTLEGQANGNYSVVWTPTQGLSYVGGDTLRPVASPTFTTVYTLRAKAGACTDSSQVTVTVRPRLRIPTAISPNGDGLDDTWQIDHLSDYPTNRVLVFNRWGSKIFETTGYGQGSEWNGTVSGQTVPIGTYYYIITLGNGKSYSGPLTVVY